ncbi:hypothetical protein GTW43_35555 [Streptomyces sp. SID5785]|uniref:hypothetical protein n=1 Tax=Streptomyces sp. SID5785 TaxID=2690309 RepID=UPI001360EE40|nr:hypothetical protein [Streptomyces sp. SID5785]MZD10357.1 hypothetical protein [Streptomyces sp. SID5785]
MIGVDSVYSLFAAALGCPLASLLGSGTPACRVFKVAAAAGTLRAARGARARLEAA